ncbi:MAG: nicotinamide mononucleotide adenylyltransferase, partial [Sphingobacterium sp.]
MAREIFETKRKALKINLNPDVYGTFAEIGAGQEVARNFFEAGAASGTIAKTISAYDMTFSDAIYGVEESGRYVSRTRVIKMLNHEFNLLTERLCGQKYQTKRFFAFANTVTTLNFAKNNEPHGWIGIRFQSVVDGPFNDIVVHVRLLDSDSRLQ